MRKVFCIGLNKTATVSLHEALTILGYRSLHWGGPGVRRSVRTALAEGRPLLADLDTEFDAFSDLEDLTYNFDVADRQYPGSKFILTVRDLDDWLDSRRRHVEYNQRRRAEGQYSGSWVDIDLERWADDFRAHEARVRAYFANRPHDLLVLDIPAASGWDPLCRFLGHALPDVPFPWRNRYGTWREPTIERR